MIKLMENVKEITENDKKISFSNIFFYVCVEVPWCPPRRAVKCDHIFDRYLMIEI